jgi:SAM-dependent methyltransferase
LSIAEQITEQQRLEGTRKSDVSPIKAPVVAKGHPPIYRMHRFFARRPHNVFEALIRHYSNPGDIVLDPFCGGGVTIVEGLRARRKVIGIDVNPMATFVTQMEVAGAPLDKLKKAKEQVAKAVKEKILRLYETKCPECGAKAIVDWIEWAYIVQCPACHKPVNLGVAKKVGAAKFQCSSRGCIATFKAEDCTRLGETMIRLKYSCSTCESRGEKSPDKKDSLLNTRIERLFDREKSKGALKYPSDALPDGNLVRENALYDKGFRFFADFYTKRNLIALAWLYQAIRSIPNDLQESMLFVFTSMLYECTCRLCHIKDGTVVKPGHDWWPPMIFASNNVWKHFETRYATVCRGFQEVRNTIGNFYKTAGKFSEITEEATCMIITGSSESMPLPDASVDVIITDPPFGSNVQYGEQTDLWVAWIKDILGLSGLTDKTKEAIATRRTGFDTAKSLEFYENKLCEIFSECRRVLKPNGWMVLTFHNRDLAVWMALQRAANKVGFKLPSEIEDPNRGMLYQPPIEQYTTTLRQQPAGAMLGDFILSFKRQAMPSHLETIVEALSLEEEELLRQRTQELIEFHGGADENLLMTGLLPYLQERNLLHRLRRFDFRRFFNTRFTYDKVQKRWFSEQHLDNEGKPLSIIDYVPAQQLTEQLVVDYLYKHQYATLDDLLAVIYSTLVNSHRPGVETVYKTLSRLCDKTKLTTSKREAYVLRRGIPKRIPSTVPLVVQAQLFSAEGAVVENLEHNQIIELLARYAVELGYQVHVGETEQRKDKHLREISIPMLSNVEFGIPLSSFDSIKEIDLVVVKGHVILVAFEVATTIATANKAINDRYRNLLATFPAWVPQAIVVVYSKDYQAARAMLLSLANERQHLSQKVKILKVSQLTHNTVGAILSEGAGEITKL